MEMTECPQSFSSGWNRGGNGRRDTAESRRMEPGRDPENRELANIITCHALTNTEVTY